MKENMNEKMTKEDLYKALYTLLDNGKENELSLENDDIRNKTLKTLLGVEEEQLSDQIEKYNKIQKAREEIETAEDVTEEVEGEEAGIEGEDVVKKDEEGDVEGEGNIFNNIVEYWKAIHHLYVCYLDKLKKSLGDNKTINKILIYEAPPMPNSDEDKIETFGKINYILAQSCEDCNINCNININCNLFTKTLKGTYSTTIKNLENEGENQNIQEILVKQGILFIDLCPLPLPMTTDIRKSVWGEDFVEKDKPLAVVLLELALRFALEEGIKISEKPIIAMGTPAATSQSIYFYFEKMIFDKMIKKDKDRNPCISIEVRNNDKTNNGEVKVRKIDFSTLLNINRKYDSKDQILPLYQSNIISGSNTPNPELLKRIF